MFVTSSSLSSYPVFPDWIFEGKLPITDAEADKLLAGMNKITRIETPYGWVSEKNNLTQSLQKMRQLIGSMFFDASISHFRLPERMRNIDSVDSEIFCVKPGMFTQTTVNRKRWYQCAVFLSPHNGSCNLELNLYGEKRQAVPRAVTEQIHVIPSERCKVVFWPAHIPWNFSVNQSAGNTVIYTNSFIFANYHR